jgi:hypothetical protein
MKRWAAFCCGRAAAPRLCLILCLAFVEPPSTVNEPCDSVLMAAVIRAIAEGMPTTVAGPPICYGFPRLPRPG